ncbi:alpha-amylase family glycosyl hydrolase [Spirosoma aerophilum]
MKSRIDINKRVLGVTFDAYQTATAVVWAPFAKKVAVVLNKDGKQLPMSNDEPGYWQIKTHELKPGDLYSFVLDDEKEFADPVSMLQPQGVYGPAQAVDTHAFYWEDSCWVNPPLDEYKTYEIDVHTFTPEGTFIALIDKLPYLKSLGVTAIVIQPITSFPDARPQQSGNVFLFAVQSTYGGPTQLQRFINACHYDGIAIIMDLSYKNVNKGAELNQYAKPYLVRKRNSPSKELSQVDETQRVANRRYLIENALMWFRDFHVDALRLNDVFALPDSEQLLHEIREHTNELTAITGRHHCLLVEFGLPDEELDEAEEGRIAGLGKPIQLHKTSEGYDRYCFGHKGNQKERAYREDIVYDEPFSSTLRELFGRPGASDSGHPFTLNQVPT